MHLARLLVFQVPPAGMHSAEQRAAHLFGVRSEVELFGSARHAESVSRPAARLVARPPMGRVRPLLGGAEIAGRVNLGKMLAVELGEPVPVLRRELCVVTVRARRQRVDRVVERGGLRLAFGDLAACRWILDLLPPCSRSRPGYQRPRMFVLVETKYDRCVRRERFSLTPPT